MNFRQALLERNVASMKSILIVDDEVDIANSIQYVLKQEGYSILLAHDGLQAMQVIENK